MRKHMPRTSTMQQFMNLKMSNNKEGIAKSVYIRSVSWWCIWKGKCLIWRRYKERNMPKLFGCQSFFPLCRSLAWMRFLCPVTVRVQPKLLSSSGRFQCPFVIHVRLKLLLLSGLSSAELVPSPIHSKRATLQSGASNSSQCPEG